MAQAGAIGESEQQWGIGRERSERRGRIKEALRLESDDHLALRGEGMESRFTEEGGTMVWDT